MRRSGQEIQTLALEARQLKREVKHLRDLLRSTGMTLVVAHEEVRA
jgi:hypothetical protein